MPQEETQSGLKTHENPVERVGIVNTAPHRLLAIIQPQVWLMLIVFLCLAPFINKAFYIDDTLFVRAGEQIQKHPLDFYGFKINWFDQTLPMSESTENPPLASYYIALVASVAV